MNGNFLIKKSLLMVAAVSAMAIPLFASATVAKDFARSTTVTYDRSAQGTANGPEALYERLKNASRKMCGSDDLLVTGSIRRVAGNEACYEGTLDAAVKRLADPAVTALHRSEFAAL
jgi:UrcA family protein